jgi:hypothetical protein
MRRIISDSDVCWGRTQETFEKITDAAASLESKGADPSWLEKKLTALQVQTLTPIDCYKVRLWTLIPSRAQKADPSRLTPTRCATEKRCRLYHFVEGWHFSFLQPPLPWAFC